MFKNIKLIEEQLEKEHRVLNFRTRSMNSTINRMSRKLITLEQAPVRTDFVSSQEFECGDFYEVDIRTCKRNLKWTIEWYKEQRDHLIQHQQRIGQMLLNTNTSNP